MNPPQRLEFGTCQASAAVFRSPINPDHYYVALPAEMDSLEFMKRYNVGNVECQQVRHADLDQDEEHFFMCYSEDCYDPPIVIVRAEDMDAAIDVFVEEFPNLGAMDEETRKEREKDGLEDTIGYTGQGNIYDTERVMVREIELVRLEFDPLPGLSDAKRAITTGQLLESCENFIFSVHRDAVGSLASRIRTAWHDCQKNRGTHESLLKWREEWVFNQPYYKDLPDDDKRYLQAVWDTMQALVWEDLVFCYEIDGKLIHSHDVVHLGLTDKCTKDNGHHCWQDENGYYHKWN